jgi:signal transduction histidine kinase
MDRMKILVVHADEGTRVRVADAIGELTNFVISGSVAHAREALSMLEADGPDVVVLGGLDESDAREVIAATRGLEPAPAVLLLTGPTEGEPRELADRVVAARAPADELQRAILAATSSRRRPRRDLAQERLALLGRLVAGLAHDVNNYLMVVDTSLAVAERHNAAVDLTRARGAIDSAARLVQTVMQYARGGAPAPEPIDVRASVRRVLDLFGRNISEDIVVGVALADDLPLVSAVAIEIEQVLLNLVLNACEAMRGTGELRLAAFVDESGAVCLEVADTGPGMSIRPGESGVTPSTKGGGLGLGIVQSVVDRHGGILRIGGGADGGSRVTISLPASAIASSPGYQASGVRS